MPVGGAGQGDRQVARRARGRSREPQPELPHGGSASAPACPFRQRDVSREDKGSWKGRIGGEKAAALECPSPGPADPGSENVTAHCCSSAVEPSLLAMSQSRDRAAALPLEHEDSGTFRSAPENSGPSRARNGVAGQEGRGRGSGSRAAFWVKPLSGEARLGGCGQTRGARAGSVVRPRPSCVLGWRAAWAEMTLGLLGNGICGFSRERLQHFY